MTEIISSYYTTGLCGVCYRELLSTIEYRSDGAAYITKTCPDHGYQEAMVEKDFKFWKDSLQLNEGNRTWQLLNDTTILEVTDRCNVRCEHCYHDPDNKIKDKPAEFIIAQALAQPTHDVILMGAEPTMRDDLAYIIREIKTRPGKLYKAVSIYTNCIKFKDAEYLQSLIDAGLDVVCMSIHHPEYHKESIWKSISQGIENIANSNVQLGQLGFTCNNKEQVNQAVDRILWFKERNRIPAEFEIRSPAKIGIEFQQEQEIFISDLENWVKEIANERGLKFQRHPDAGSNPYHVGFLFEDMYLQLSHWPTVHSVDTSYMYMGPWASLIPNTRGTFIIQAILRDGLKNGWWQGQRVVPEITQTIKFIN